jgi:hypothetical protein
MIDDAAENTLAGVSARLVQQLHARLTGDLPAAARFGSDAIDLAVRLMGMDDETPRVLPRVADVLIESGAFDAARAVLSHVDSVDAYRVPPLLAAQALRLHGTIEATDPASTADPADVERDLRAGIDALDRFGAIPARARTQAVLGSHLTRLGRTADAAEHLDAARATFTDLGAIRWLRDLDEAVEPRALTS